jgi:hypothetical protein
MDGRIYRKREKEREEEKLETKQILNKMIRLKIASVEESKKSASSPLRHPLSVAKPKQLNQETNLLIPTSHSSSPRTPPRIPTSPINFMNSQFLPSSEFLLELD